MDPGDVIIDGDCVITIIAVIGEDGEIRSDLEGMVMSWVEDSLEDIHELIAETECVE